MDRNDAKINNDVFIQVNNPLDILSYKHNFLKTD